MGVHLSHVAIFKDLCMSMCITNMGMTKNPVSHYRLNLNVHAFHINFIQFHSKSYNVHLYAITCVVESHVI
jgi:hypothetical protein